ncbi:MAG: TIGR00730 family Rossman fold protein [Planctomycetota bacterium]|nr:MAG: TIGR00730 family Rossman fold protein [Planctomycetota bacterium]
MRICVFCGSKVGVAPAYREAARAFARTLVAAECEVVYGGGSVGLMGVLADAALEAGGRVIGVIPRKLATTELMHPRVKPMYVTETMHERKAKMAELSDAFVALPGGFGTFEEFFEVVTWAQLRFHHKPVGVLNVAGYFDPLVRLIDHAVQEGFIKPKHRELVLIEERAERLIDQLRRIVQARRDATLPADDLKIIG